MKYIAVVDDNFISNFRRDDDGLTLVVKDKADCQRATRLKPIARPLLVMPDGQSLYLTQEHIDTLMDFEAKQKLKETVEWFYGRGANEE